MESMRSQIEDNISIVQLAIGDKQRIRNKMKKGIK